MGSGALSVQALCTGARGCRPGPAPAHPGAQLGFSRGSHKRLQRVRFHPGCVFLGLAPENNYQVPLSKEGGGSRVVGGGDSLQHVQKLLRRPQELLAWPEPVVTCRTLMS